MIDLKHFKFDIDEATAIVTIDRSDDPINTLGPAIFDEFSAILDRIETDPGINGAVLVSGKADFIVGADIRWFATLETAEQATAAIASGQMMFGRIERLHQTLGKPVVVAIHGAALGGGLELALCGATRIATDDPRTKLGQPEVQLGLIPAGGGTQRLPRLVGLSSALDIILTGRSVTPRQALKMGLVDEVVPKERLLEVARDRARRPGDAPKARRISAKAVGEVALEKNKAGRRVLFAQAEKRVLQETKGNYPAPVKALEAIRIGIDDGFDQGLAAEARFFGELVVSPESRALRTVFFDQRASEKERFSDTAMAVRKVAVLGGGLMGGGIAAVSALNAGARVRIKEVDEAGVGRGLGYVSRYLDGRVKRRRLTPFEAEQARLRVTGSHQWVGFAGTDLVIEAVFEDLDVKRQMIADAERAVSGDFIFASNTSSLPISAIAEASRQPENVLGMHYFSPVEKMPLLEVVITSKTSSEAIQIAVDFGRRQGKTVIVVNDGTGFYTSRILGPYATEAMFLLEEGAAVDEIDAAMASWGFPVGPLLLSDEVGLDVGAKISKIMVDAFGDRMRPPEMMNGLITDDRKGRKNGRGYYRYDKDGKRGGVDKTVYAALGLGRRNPIPTDQIQERLALQLINEAARCLEEGVLRSARDGDIGAVFGIGFPPFRGGPFLWVDTVGVSWVVDRLEHHRATHGERFAPAKILINAAENGTRFR